MTVRVETSVYVDAATVYAEGVLAGLRTACNVLDKAGAGLLTPPQRKAVDVVLASCTRDQREKLRAALSVCELNIPPQLHALVRAQRAVVYHNQWLAERGRPARLPDMPARDVLMARIHAFMQVFPEFDHDDQ